MKIKFDEHLKTKTYKEQETIKERGKKRFQERLAEEKEAEQEIDNFIYEPEELIDNDELSSNTLR